jgi:malonyl-CoA O-methyltransferase
MPDFDKKIIAEKFGSAAKNYDEAALVQAAAVDELCDLLQNDGEGKTILDLGSGTSFIAKKFSTQKNIKFFEVDIAENMLKQWANRPSENFFAIQADIENLPFEKESFDILLSSFSLQWLTNFEKNFAHFFSLLKPNGIFAFCLPTFESLSELRAASVESECNFHFNDLPKIENLKSALSKSEFQIKKSYTKIIKQEFQNGSDALKSLQKTGANISLKNNIPVTKTKLRKFNNFHLKNSNLANKTAPISWFITFFLCVK